MTVDINSISINTEGLETGFDYADMLQELADEVDAFRNTYRDKLTQQQRDRLRSFASRIREEAARFAVIIAIELLEQLEPELNKIRLETRKLDDLLTDIKNTKAIISGLAEIIGVLVNILSFIPAGI
jgi:hypothetical protein